jgi:hypothetical protein
VTCDHRRWGIRDCRKARHRRRQCILQVGSGRTIPVVKDAQDGSGRTIPVVKDAQDGSGRTIPVVRGVLRGLTLRQRALNIWVFVGDVREEFILGLGTPRAYHSSGRGMPWATTGQDVVSVREEPTASVSTRPRSAESHGNRQQLCWQCGGTCRLGRESLGGRNQGAENTNSVTRACTGTKGGRPAACNLPDSASGRRRPTRTSRKYRPNKGAAG